MVVVSGDLCSLVYCCWQLAGVLRSGVDKHKVHA